MTDSSGVWTTLYDEFHRAVGMTNPWSETTTVQFDTAGRVWKKTLPNGMYEEHTFDNRSRPTYVRTYNSSAVLQDTKAYVWDVASRVVSATEGGVTTTYGYDLIDQLTSETRTGYAASYTYDANGNRLTRTVNSVTETYDYDDADKLLSVSGGSNPRTFAYDDCGRTTAIAGSGGTTTFGYDYDGKVTSITYPGSVSDLFGYNGLGARVSSSGVNGSKTFRRAGIGVTSSVLGDGAKLYTPGVSSREGGTSTYQHSGLKNATEQTSSAQSQTASRQYDAFGNLTASSGTWQGPFGYAGSFGYQEDGNGLKLLGHRYYDSSLGRFVTSDPIGDGRNWYGYVSNNPVTGADPNGLMAAAILGPAAVARQFMLFACVVVVVAVVAYCVYTVVTEQQVSPTIRRQIDESGRDSEKPTPQKVGGPITYAPPVEPESDDWETVYRVYGGKAGEYGAYWSPQDPRTMKNPRGELGLPNSNSGEHVIVGRVRRSQVNRFGFAAPLDGNPGGAPEWVIHDANGKVIPIGGWDPKPAYWLGGRSGYRSGLRLGFF
jgi:RHS repeat-associated protein